MASGSYYLMSDGSSRGSWAHEVMKLWPVSFPVPEKSNHTENWRGGEGPSCSTDMVSNEELI